MLMHNLKSSSRIFFDLLCDGFCVEIKGGTHRFSGFCSPKGEEMKAERGSLEEFLFERYSLYVEHEGNLCIAHTQHDPWVYTEGDVTILDNALTESFDLGIKDPLTPDCVHMSDGVFVHTGFKPAWFMLKRTDSANDWIMFDNKRDAYQNPFADYLFANLSDAENADTARGDFLSNGVKMAMGIRTRKGEKKHFTSVRLILAKPELMATPSKDLKICIIVRANVDGESLVKIPYIPESKMTKTETRAQTPRVKKDLPSDLKSSDKELKIKNKYNNTSRGQRSELRNTE